MSAAFIFFKTEGHKLCFFKHLANGLEGVEIEKKEWILEVEFIGEKSLEERLLELILLKINRE